MLPSEEVSGESLGRELLTNVGQLGEISNVARGDWPPWELLAPPGLQEQAEGVLTGIQ